MLILTISVLILAGICLRGRHISRNSPAEPSATRRRYLPDGFWVEDDK